MKFHKRTVPITAQEKQSTPQKPSWQPLPASPFPPGFKQHRCVVPALNCLLYWRESFCMYSCGYIFFKWRGGPSPSSPIVTLFSFFLHYQFLVKLWAVRVWFLLPREPCVPVGGLLVLGGSLLYLQGACIRLPCLCDCQAAWPWCGESWRELEFYK